MSLGIRNAADPYYLQRAAFTGVLAAGAAAQSSKFIAHAALLLWSLNGVQTVLSTSTYTNTVNGTATATVSAQQVSVIVISNTNTAAGFGGTGSAAFSTTTIGPFTLGGGYSSAGGTSTAQVNSPNQFTINTAAGVANQGGVPVPAGSVVYVVGGTDATAQSSFSIDYSVQQLAPVTL